MTPDKFWTMVDKTGDCWTYTGFTRLGYGMVQYKKDDGKWTSMGAHRYSLWISTGQHPGDKFVCHRCDNRLCVRPEHLFLGTHQDNVNDMLSKQRQTSTLTEEFVRQARLAAAKGENVGVMARDAGYTKASVLNAVRGKTWEHLDTPPVEDVVFYTRRKANKLTHEQVLEILEALKKPYWGQVNDLAAKYGVTHSHISHIKRGYWSPIHIGVD